MKHDLLKATVLAIKVIANASKEMLQELGGGEDCRSLGLITADIDDVTYTALDEATKKAAVKVVYAKSCYGGAVNSNSKLTGEVIGILAGPDPEEVKSGLDAVINMIGHSAHFVSANEDDSISYYAHCISRSGSYLAEAAGVREGEPIAYLIAPPLEALYALDAALKSADVRLCVLYGPPTETNFGGALLTGSQSACQAACDAFAAAVQYVAENPLVY